MAAKNMSEHAVVKKSRLRRWLVLAVIGLGLPASGWAVWSYLFYGPPEDDLVVLRADPTPFRVKPADGTQANVPNQDSTFMNLIDGNNEPNSQSEVISLSDPAPEPPPIPLAPASPEQDNTVASAEDKDAEDSKAAEQAASQDGASEAPQQIMTAQPATEQQPDDASADNQSLTASTADSPQPGPTDLTASLTPPAAPKPRPAGAKDRRDWMMVQLAAFREEDKARTAAALLNEKHKARLNGYSLGVSSVTSTDGQLFWRVITDALPKQDALSVCEELKRAGQDCILRRQKEQSP